MFLEDISIIITLLLTFTKTIQILLLELSRLSFTGFPQFDNVALFVRTALGSYILSPECIYTVYPIK